MTVAGGGGGGGKEVGSGGKEVGSGGCRRWWCKCLRNMEC